MDQEISFMMLGVQ